MESSSLLTGNFIRLASATVAILFLAFYFGYESEYQPVVNVTIEPESLARMLRVQRGMPRKELRRLRVELQGGSSDVDPFPNSSTPVEDPATSIQLGFSGKLGLDSVNFTEVYLLDHESDEVRACIQYLVSSNAATAKGYFLKIAKHLAENERCANREAGFCFRNLGENEDEEVLYLVGTCVTGQRILSFTPQKRYEDNNPAIEIFLNRPESLNSWKRGCSDAAKDANEVKEAFRRHGLLDAYTAFLKE